MVLEEKSSDAADPPHGCFVTAAAAGKGEVVASGRLAPEKIRRVRDRILLPAVRPRRSFRDAMAAAALRRWKGADDTRLPEGWSG
uniref:Uncharacterized protein n=1 Tax=Arundo donax TaxID=35708 RepID=A0A0A9GH75_ARUDO